MQCAVGTQLPVIRCQSKACIYVPHTRQSVSQLVSHHYPKICLNCINRQQYMMFKHCGLEVERCTSFTSCTLCTCCTCCTFCLYPRKPQKRHRPQSLITNGPLVPQPQMFLLFLNFGLPCLLIELCPSWKSTHNCSRIHPTLLVPLLSLISPIFYVNFKPFFSCQDVPIH